MKKRVLGRPSAAALLAVCLSVFFGCTPEQKGPTYCSIDMDGDTPTASTQNVKFVVECDYEWSASISEGCDWASIVRKTLSETGGELLVNVTLNLGESRRTKVILTSGDKTVEADLVQKGISSLIDPVEVVLGTGESAYLNVYPMGAWSMEVPQDAGWFELNRLSGNGPLTLTVTETSGDSYPLARKASLVYSCRTDKVTITVRQKTEEDEGFVDPLAGKQEYGIYQKEENTLYMASVDQLSRRYRDGRLAFSILSPKSRSYVTVSGIDPEASAGDEMQVEISGSGWTAVKATARVIQSKDGKMWLRLTDDSAMGLIVKL